MGVPGLWDILRPVGHTRSLTHLSVVDGFERNRDGVRGFRVGIDASIWFYHAAYGREGENPELRTLFFRCSRLMAMPFLPLFVFDGPKRPDVKRGKRISGKNHWMVQGMQEIIGAFGFEWRMAPGEAEAELAYLNRIGVIDAVLSDDVDTFLFGATMVVRNPSTTLSGNRAHSLKNTDGRDDGQHVATYRAVDFAEDPSVGLTHGGLILIGILRGGDYHPAGLAGCGTTTAHGLAKCGFGDTLLDAARTLPRAQLPAFLEIWRAELRVELRTNAQGLIGRKNPSLAKALHDDFPNIDVLLAYTHPVTSEAKGPGHSINIDWTKEPDLGKIAALCEMYFEWGVREIIIKRFRTVLWPAATLRILRRAALVADRRDAARRREDTDTMPQTPRKNARVRPTPVGTPSKMIARHFSSLQLGSPTRKTDSDSEVGGGDGDIDDDQLIVKIHSARTHASTDGLLEYRVEVAPAQLVRLCEAGVRGLRTALPPELEESDDDEEADDGEGTEGGKVKATTKPPPDPQSHLRIWMPASMVRFVAPDLVDEFEDVQRRRQAKKAGKGAVGGARSGKALVDGKTKSRKKAAVRDEEQASSSGSEIPQKKLPAPRRKKTTVASIVEEDELFPATSQEKLGVKKPTIKVAQSPRAKGMMPSVNTKSGQTRKPVNLKQVFTTTKPMRKTTAKANIDRVSALFDGGSSLALKPNATRRDALTVVDVSDGSGNDNVSTRPSSRQSRHPFTSSSRTSSSSTSAAAGSSGTTHCGILSFLDSGHISPSHEPSAVITPVPSPSRRIPRPFPLSFDDTDDTGYDDPFTARKSPSTRPITSQRTRRRSLMSSDTDARASKYQKSPRKSNKRDTPQSNRVAECDKDEESDDSDRPVSPSPLKAGRTGPIPKIISLVPRRNVPTSAADRSIIEISSDSDSPPSTIAKAPLILARAKTLSSSILQSETRPTNLTSKSDPTTRARIPAVRKTRISPIDDIIDLT